MKAVPGDFNEALRLIETLESKVHLLGKELVAKARENKALTERLQTLLEKIYGRRSEKLDPNQLSLLLSEQSEASDGETPAPFAGEAPDAEEVEEIVVRRKKGGTNGRTKISEDIPRIRIEHLPEERDCACCGGELRSIGEEITEELEYRPASMLVKQHVRPRMACPKCQGNQVTIAHPPELPIEKGRPGPGLLAYILTAKYCDHLPLHRLEGIIARHGVEISRSTMCNWVRDAAELLTPVVNEIRKSVLTSAVIQSDDTPVRMQENQKKGGAKTCRLWSYVGDQDEVVYDFTLTRAGEGPLVFLAGYQGYLQADGYCGYDGLYSSQKVIHVGCWAHVRRKFKETLSFEPVRAALFMALIQQLYRIESKAREEGLQGEDLLALRQAEAGPCLDEIKEELYRTTEDPLAKDRLSLAINYAKGQWESLIRYAEDPRLSIDNNACERTMRRVAVGRNYVDQAVMWSGPRRAS